MPLSLTLLIIAAGMGLLPWPGPIFHFAGASESPERECCDPIYPLLTPTASTVINPTSLFPTVPGPPGPNVQQTVEVMKCLLAKHLCQSDPTCSVVIDLLPTLCGIEQVACSTVTVVKCQAALRLLQSYQYFRPTCLCREKSKDPECNQFRDMLFDHPCIYVLQKDVTKVTLSHEKEFEMNVISAAGSGGALFRRSKENYVFNGSQLLRLHKQNGHGITSAGYSLNPALELAIEEGFIFIKQIDWQNIFFLGICYPESYCQVVMTHSVTGVTIQQRIATHGSPFDLEFFVDNHELYLIIVTDPCTIYRWTGTYFDVHEELDTSGAKAVAVFRDKDFLVLAVAQSMKDKKVYSKIYVRKNRKTELTQLLQTAEAIDVVPYELRVGADVLKFLLVLDNVESKIFWWNGREFSLWHTPDSLVGPSRIYVDTIQAELFIFIISQNKLTVYHPTQITFDLVQVFEFEREIISFDLREERGGSKTVLLLMRSEYEPFLTLSFISIAVNYIPLSESQTVDADPALQCLLELGKNLSDRNAKLDESISLSEEITKNSGKIKLENLSIPRLELKSFRIKHLKVNPGGKELEATPKEIKKEIQDIKDRSEAILARIRSTRKGARYRIHSNVTINRLRAPRIHVRKFNDRTFDLSNILSATKNQTLSGIIRLNTLSAGTLTLPSINGVHINDILRRNKPIQEITGEHTIQSVKAKNIVLGKLGKLNGSFFTRPGRTEDETIRGKKIFSRMNVNELQVDRINNVTYFVNISYVPADEWLSRILPNSEVFRWETVLNFTNLKVKNLTVAKINGLPWANYLDSLTQETSGSVRVNNIKAKRLMTKRVNTVDIGLLMTKDTPQNVSSTLEVTLANSKYIKPKHFDFGRGCGRTGQAPKSEPGLFNQIKTSEVIFKNPVNISGKILNLDKFNETYWMKSQPQVIRTPITFAAEVRANNARFHVINNRTISDFVGLDKTNVTSQIVFDSVEVLGNVTLSPGAYNQNSLRSLYNSAVKTKGENRVKGEKKFLGKVTANNLFFDFVNGENSTANSDRTKALKRCPVCNGDDIKCRNQSPRILDKWQEEGTQRICSHGFIHNNHEKDPNTVCHTEKLQRVEIIGDLFVKAEVNIKKLNKQPNPFVNKLSPSMTSRKSNEEKQFKKNRNLKIIINGDLMAPEIVSTTVNDVLFSDYMSKVVLKNATQNKIKGRKVFRGKVTVRGNLDGILNGHDLTELKAIALSKTEAQNITGTVIADELNANNVESKIFDGVPSHHLLFEDQSEMQFINSDVMFSDIAVIGNLETHLLDVNDLSKIMDVNLEKIHKIVKLDVKGNVTWDKDRKDYKGISYLYKNSVKSHHEQIVTGSVTFSANASFDRVNTKKHINDIDLGFILNDALYRSLPIQEITHDMTFKGRVTADSVLITSNAIVDNINEIDILDFGQRLVRKSEDAEVRGTKKFSHGFSTFRLRADEVNGAKTEDIIFCDGSQPREPIKFPRTQFHSVKTIESLDVLRVNSENLSELLEGRLSKTRRENISAFITLKGSLLVKGEADISEINDVKVSDTISVSEGVLPRPVRGPIEFNDTLSIISNLEVDTLNEYNISDIYERSLMNETDSILVGNVTFSDGIELDGIVNVLNLANGCEVKGMKALDVPQNIGEIDMAYLKRLESETDRMSNVSDKLTKPVVFMDLKVRSNFMVDAVNVEKVIALNESEFHVYGWSDGEGCGCQSNCSCSVQTKLTMSSSSLTTEKVFPSYYKYYDDNLDVEFVVNTTSKLECPHNKVNLEEEHPLLTWKGMAENSSVHHSTLNIPGFITDVRYFRMAKSVYLILVSSVHPVRNATTKVNIVVKEVDTVKGVVKTVQEIPAKGAQILDIFWSPKGFVLVAGNGYDSEIFTDSVESAIYRFSDSENKFQLLRSVNTHGILSITSVAHNKNSFIFLTQKQSWPFLILKYNHEHDNYYFSQKLDVAQSRVKSNFLSGAAFTTSRPGYDGDIFLGVVQSDESFRLFKYKHIEGFVEEVKQGQSNVKILLPFSTESKQYLLAISSGTNSSLYEVIQDGFTE